jgi:uncharacterized membrane protein YgdD (TMEM256/DUF423 family)
MHKSFLFAGALFGGLAVALGAFGAHGLQNVTADEAILHIFQTGVQYQMYHALALLAVAILYEKIPFGMIRWTGCLFITGMILFSGSLYAITALKISGITVPVALGVVTPAGGLCLIAGWLLLLIGCFQKRS